MKFFQKSILYVIATYLVNHTRLYALSPQQPTSILTIYITLKNHTIFFNCVDLSFAFFDECSKLACCVNTSTPVYALGIINATTSTVMSGKLWQIGKLNISK